MSDYCGLLAAGLVDAGAKVIVWAPPTTGVTPNGKGVIIHRSAGKWSPADLARLGEELNAFSAPRRLLVQYVANGWGYRGLNFGFCRWLVERRKSGDDVRPMLHETFHPWTVWERPTRWILGAGQRLMMRTVLAASSQVYLSTPVWERYVRPYEPARRRQMQWLPIPSTIPVVANPEEVIRLRHQLAVSDQIILGAFSIGRFGGVNRKVLSKVLSSLLTKNPERIGILLGRGSDHFVAELVAHYPWLKDRLIPTGEVAPEQLSLYLQVCDLLIQSYPDGVNSRRTSVMAGLSHGLPTVTTPGLLSEPVWRESGCVALAAAFDSAAIIHTAERLLADPKARAALGDRARTVYAKHFAWERTIAGLLREE